MSAATIIQSARSDGVTLTLSPSGTIKAVGDGAAVNRWLPVIRTHKADIIGILKGAESEAANTPANPVADIQRALGRPLAYLLGGDDRLPGLCLMIEADIEDIRTGRLPLSNARLYLERTEAAHPHLAERLERTRQEAAPAPTRPGQPTLEDGIERLRAGGLELVQDDVRFIRERIGTRADWQDLLGEYQVRWLLAAATEPAPHRRINVGRRAANQWLLETTR